MTIRTTDSEEPHAYQLPGDKLDQGDIFFDVPWGLVQSPPVICRCPHGINVETGTGHFAPRDKVRQAFARGDGREIVHAVAFSGPVLVLWHGCQIDKFKEHGKGDKAFVAVVPILPLTRLNEVDREPTRLRENMARFYLPPFESAEGSLPESYADLRHIWPIRQASLMKRLATLTTTTRADLVAHLFTFLTRLSIPGDIICPSCGATIDADAILIPASENAES